MSITSSKIGPFSSTSLSKISTTVRSLKPNSTSTLLLNCCHGRLPVIEKGKYNKELEYINNPVQILNRLIQGAQLCPTYMDDNDIIYFMNELKKKDWDSLNHENIQKVKNLIENMNIYKDHQITSSPSDYEYYYDELKRQYQFHNNLQYMINTFNEKIINKIWTIEEESSPKEKKIMGIYFVNETTFIVPPIDRPYLNNLSNSITHFNYETNQITYSTFYNILMCPIYKQFNYYYSEFDIPLKKDWNYNINTNKYSYVNMISETNAFTLYNYLSNIPNVSMIDNSCEIHELNQEVNKLKKLRDSYRKLGPKVGKKLVKQITKKIYRLEDKLKTKARGKTNKNIFKLYGKKKINTRRRR
jgi:hypothetical protein